MIRIYKDENDKNAIKEHLIQNIEFLMGKYLSSIQNDVASEIFESIEEIITREYDDTLPLEKTIYLDNGKTNLNLVTTKANIWENIISRSYTHGLYHVIISYLNNKYGANSFRENRFNGLPAFVTNYNGMLHIVDMDGIHYTVGNMFLELFIDFISFLTTNQNRENFNINDYILGDIKIEDEAASDYNPLFSIIRLMLVAFNNDPEFNYQNKLCYGIINSACIVDNNQTIIRNNFLDGVLINPILILDTWDLMMGDADYIDFAYYADDFFNMYLDSGEINRKELIEILDSITCFANKRYQFLLDNEIINLVEFKKLKGYYDKVYKNIKREFFGFKVKTARIFKQVLTKSTDKAFVERKYLHI